MLIVMAMIAMGGTYALVRGYVLAPTDGYIRAARKDAAVMQAARTALIGAVLARTTNISETNPGRLPCPESPADATGASAGLPANWSSANPFGACTPTATGVVVGRFPWRAVGIAQPLDSAGETLWYAVSTNWVPPSTSATLTVNSNLAAGLTLDGQAAIAVVFSVGQVLSGQTRVAAMPSYVNYLDGENSSPLDTAFVTGTASTTFNDKAVGIALSDLMPHIEAAVADRFENQLAPLMKSAYSGSVWGSTTVLPFALTFADPSSQAAYANTVAASTQGLLPVSYFETSPGSGALCTPSASDPRCNPMFVQWLSSPAPTMTRTGGQAIAAGPTCSITTSGTAPSQATAVRCQFLTLVNGPTNVRMVATASNVGKAFRQLNTNASMTNLSTAGRSATGVLNADGSATITLEATTNPGTSSLLDALTCIIFTGINASCFYFDIYVPIYLLADHPLVDVNDGTTGWFLRNKWHETAYYAVSSGIAPSGTRTCATPPATPSCLEATGYTSSGSLRGLIVLSGRTLASASRPNGTLTDWLEGGNADGVTPFEYKAGIHGYYNSFNDRIATVDKN